MKHAEIRQAFVEFFQSKNHQFLESFSLIPHGDPSLLFTNAGMNPFKNVFLGIDKAKTPRAVTIQKCLRAGGKHNDLENVGWTARHHTFFEMMGNFSFGDYFKKEAIALAWEFLTQKLALPPHRLYVTVFTTDDEAAEIWEKDMAIPQERIFRYGEKDNFWRMGKTGPCGPCSEIFYDHYPNKPKRPLHEDEERFVEIWNLVFMEFFEDEHGNQSPLPKPSVDTGAGLERLAAVMQSCSDNYQSDLFEPLIGKICEITGLKPHWQDLSQKPETLGAIKVVADHARTAAFLIGEGVLPSNEGRGYVLRRIMRRAIRYARKLNSKASLYPEVVAEVIKTMKAYYPFLEAKAPLILKAVGEEEQRFLKTLDKGSEILLGEIGKYKKQGFSKLPGKSAVTLYDTYGFPLDLTQLMAREHGMGVDEKEFSTHMEALRNLARQAHRSHHISMDEKHLGEWTRELSPTPFQGYEQLSLESEIISLSDGHGERDELHQAGWVVFASTPFYAEGGGQVSDQGKLYDSQTGHQVGSIQEVKKVNEVFIHYVELETPLKRGQKYELKVHRPERQRTAHNHSATHLLHAALKEVLGNHVVQAGSLVNGAKLRFDFNHGQALVEKELEAIEKKVNEQIAGSYPVSPQIMGQKEAKALGATALFGEKYGDEVRVISMGERGEEKVFSMELCGGTHVTNTAQIRLFKILSETGVAAGVRRIEAITGERAFNYLNQLARENIKARGLINKPVPGVDQVAFFKEELVDSIEDLKFKVKDFEKQLQKLKAASLSLKDILKEAQERKLGVSQGLALITRLPTGDRNLLRDMADKLRDQKRPIALVLIGESEGGGPKPMVVALSSGLKNLHAGEMIKELCAIMDGRGGGRPDFAQGSVQNLDKLNLAKDRFYELLEP